MQSLSGNRFQVIYPIRLSQSRGEHCRSFFYLLTATQRQGNLRSWIHWLVEEIYIAVTTWIKWKVKIIHYTVYYQHLWRTLAHLFWGGNLNKYIHLRTVKHAEQKQREHFIHLSTISGIACNILYYVNRNLLFGAFYVTWLVNSVPTAREVIKL